jgi:hypothetical protein
LADLLKSLMERQATKAQSADRRLLALQKELTDRYYICATCAQQGNAACKGRHRLLSGAKRIFRP